MRRLLAVLAALIALPVLALALYFAVLYWNSLDGVAIAEGEITAARRPAGEIQAQRERQAAGRARVEREGAPQILFGDLHVHTNYSADAALQGVELLDREGPSPPADACDFARFCSQLDFWSINDHAESLTPEHWTRTVDAVRQCNDLAGDPSNPDLVSFLGWEWSHGGLADSHYGHKNVIFRDTEDGQIPTRPIASSSGPPAIFLSIGAIAPLVHPAPLSAWSNYHSYARKMLALDDCPEGFPVRDLPEDCREAALDPPALFAKLEDWGFPALVIPHGLAWGTTNPPHANLNVQLGMHDPRWQPLLEVYSGHGNSEVYREFERAREQPDESWSCPTGGEDMELCCERAETLTRARCDDPESAACDAQVAEAQQNVSGLFGSFGSPIAAVEGSTLEEWGDCGQLRESFLPAYNYRPRQSAQYGLALGSAKGKTTDARFRWGFIGASDNHRSRPGTGYREFGRQLMTDGVGYPLPGDLMDTRGRSFYYTGGLAAVHAGARNREAIFDAIQNRHVYATSGDRTLLWFDLIDAQGMKHPMGSEVAHSGAPHFEVRALGAFEQKAGCPEFVHAALTAERIATLCREHCFNPADTRKPIARIEVVRIRPQADAAEAIRPLIEDPWRSFECPADGGGCAASFDDPEFAAAGRETVYYVRAIQAASPAVNGAQLRCERDAAGRCTMSRPCGTLPSGLPDDCLAEVEERAWSSPIFVDFRPARP
jgi:hypothetical protein